MLQPTHQERLLVIGVIGLIEEPDSPVRQRWPWCSYYGGSLTCQMSSYTLFPRESLITALLSSISSGSKAPQNNYMRGIYINYKYLEQNNIEPRRTTSW